MQIISEMTYESAVGIWEGTGLVREVLEDDSGSGSETAVSLADILLCLRMNPKLTDKMSEN